MASTDTVAPASSGIPHEVEKKPRYAPGEVIISEVTEDDLEYLVSPTTPIPKHSQNKTTTANTPNRQKDTTPPSAPNGTTPSNPPQPAHPPSHSASRDSQHA